MSFTTDHKSSQENDQYSLCDKIKTYIEEQKRFVRPTHIMIDIMVDIMGGTNTYLGTNTNTDLGTNTNTDLDTNTNTDLGTNTNTDLDTNTNTDLDTNTNIDLGTNTNTDLGTNTDISTNTNTAIGTDIDVAIGTNTDTDVAIGTNTDTDVVIGTNTDTDVAIGTNTDTKTNANLVVMESLVGFICDCAKNECDKCNEKREKYNFVLEIKDSNNIDSDKPIKDIQDITSTYQDKRLLKQYNEEIESIRTGTQYFDSLLMSCPNSLDIPSGIFHACPQNIHHGPFVDANDEYCIIFGAENEKNIVDGCNTNFFEYIEGTHIPKGAYNYVNGKKWMNGLIAYNAANIIVRDVDYGGQPGMMCAVSFRTLLDVKIMKLYIIPMLIRKINENEINLNSDPNTIRRFIEITYSDVLKAKMKLRDELTDGDVTMLSEVTLFADAPIAESLDKLIDPKDRKICELEKSIKVLEFKMNSIVSKMKDIEENILDTQIKCYKN
jgi:hypothetical protein